MSFRLKPKKIQDIKGSYGDVFAASPERVNLGYVKPVKIPLTRFLKAAVVLVSGGFLVFGSAAAPTTRSASALTPAEQQEERQALENQLKELEGQIDQYENQISGYQKQGTTLKGEITRLNDKISKLTLQIKAINLTLAQLDRKISETQFQITSTETSISSNKAALSQLIRDLYSSDRTTLVEIFLKSPQLSDFFSDINNITVFQNNIRVTISRITDLQNQLKDHEEELALAKADAQTVQKYQASQKVETDRVKLEKNKLLTTTKGQESKYQSLLKETQKTAAQIRSRIFELLGGGELTFEQAYEYAKLASVATGVRPALILAVLDRESALGKNVGRCSYKTAMSPNNQKLFVQIVADLNLSLESVVVSCPNADGVYGGAMGPAQFIPSTWNLYKDEIARMTGHSPASPWNNADAFMATALYMRDAGAVNASIAGERTAAAKYYAGGNWRRYLWTYGEAVVSRAQKFQADIETITG